MLGVPCNAVSKLYAATTKDVQRASNRQVDLAVAELFDRVEILEASTSTRIRHRNGAPLGKLADEFVVNSLLQTLIVGGVDQEFAAERLQERNGL